MDKSTLILDWPTLLLLYFLTELEDDIKCHELIDQQHSDSLERNFPLVFIKSDYEMLKGTSKGRQGNIIYLHY